MANLDLMFEEDYEDLEQELREIEAEDAMDDDKAVKARASRLGRTSRWGK